MFKWYSKSDGLTGTGRSFRIVVPTVCLFPDDSMVATTLPMSILLTPASLIHFAVGLSEAASALQGPPARCRALNNADRITSCKGPSDWQNGALTCTAAFD